MVNNSTWKVKVLKTGEFEVVKAQLTAGKDYSKRLTIPVMVVAIYGNGKKILVDTGINDADWINEAILGDYDASCYQSEKEKLPLVLKESLCWNPEDVDIVINTHLHYDHCGNNSLFKNANFIVQKSEWDEAFSPFKLQEAIFYKPLFDHNAVNYFNWKFVDGEEEVLSGIIVFQTPGHTNGHQSVIVNTEEGVICIAGDICNLVENLAENIPPGLVIDNEKALSSFDEIRKKSKYIIPQHDPCIKNFQVSDFPNIN